MTVLRHISVLKTPYFCRNASAQMFNSCHQLQEKSCDIPLKQRRVSWDFCFCMRCKSIRMCLVFALLLKKCLVGVPCAGCPVVCAGRFRLRDLRAVRMWLLRVPDGVRRGLSYHKDEYSVYWSVCSLLGTDATVKQR